MSEKQECWLDLASLTVRAHTREELQKKLEAAKQALDYLQSENVEVKQKMKRVQEARTHSDEIMNRLFVDPKFKAMIKERLREIQLS